MNFIRLIPILISVILLAAHFLRAGQIYFVIAIMGIPALLFLRHKYVVPIVSIGLIAGGIEWIRTTLHLIEMRQALGMPFLRLTLIMGAVTLFTFGSIFIFRNKTLKRRYYKQNEKKHKLMRP